MKFVIVRENGKQRRADEGLDGRVPVVTAFAQRSRLLVDARDVEELQMRDEYLGR